MGYYSNLHITRQRDHDIYDRSDWGNVNEYLLEDLQVELDFCNEHRPKNWNDQYFAAELAKATSLRAQIIKNLRYANPVIPSQRGRRVPYLFKNPLPNCR